VDSSAASRKIKAVCASRIEDFFFNENALPNFRISNIFDRTSSWTIDTTKTLLLSHEQLHFDISELFARKIRRGIEELRIKKVSDKNHYAFLISSKLKERDRYQREYDDDTFHGGIDIIQREWIEKVKKELGQLEAYKTKPTDCGM
jgi:hypothetical protein